MSTHCARWALISSLENRLHATGEAHPDRGDLEAATSRAKALPCPPACGLDQCAIGRDDPILQVLANGQQGGEPEPTTIIFND